MIDDVEAAALTAAQQAGAAGGDEAPSASGRRRVTFIGPNPRDPRFHVASVLIPVQILGQVFIGFDLSIAQLLVSLLTCAVIEVSIRFARERVIAWPASAMLTGNGVALLLRVPGTEHGDWWSLRGWWIFAGVGAASLLSKYIVRAGGRPVFNPSNLGLAVGFLVLGSGRADPQDLWWGSPSVGLFLVYGVVVTGGLVVTRRLRLLGMAASFALAFATATAVLGATGHCMTARWHVGPVCGASYWSVVTLSPELLIFMFFMLTDPRTTPSGRRQRVAFGAGVGTLAGVLVALQTTEFATKVAILVALTVCCVLRPLIERVADRPWHVPVARPSFAAPVVRWSGLLVPLVAVVFLADSVSAPEPAAHRERPSVNLDLASLPEVEIDPAVDEVITGMSQETARRMLTDLAVDLELSAQALEQRDPKLAATATTGDALVQLRKSIHDYSTGTFVASHRYEFDRARLLLVGGRPTPQSLPQLGLRVGGIERTGNGTDAKRAPFEATFALVEEGDVFLLAADDRGGHGLSTQGTATIDVDEFADVLRIGRDVDESSQPDQLPLFDDVTASAGVHVATGSARLEKVPVPSRKIALENAPKTPIWTSLMLTETYFISGQAWGDVDNDGWPDLFVTNQNGPNHLFVNRGDGTFERAPAALADPLKLSDEHSGGATWVDYDNDGWRDLHVLSDDGAHLFHNERGKRFVDVTRSAGVKGEGKGSTASWGDVNGDGLLDVYVANYGCQPCEPYNRPPAPARERDQDLLFVNDGDGTFTDRTDWIRSIPGTKGLAFAAVWFDYNGDGRPDLYVANDVRDDQGSSDVAAGRIRGDGSTPGNVLIENDGPGCGGWCFKDVTAATGTGIRADAMGLVADDLDGDGLIDLFFTNGGYQAGPSALLHNNGNGTFTNVAGERNANLGEWSWGASSLDADNDSRRDLFVSVGYSDALLQLPAGAFTDQVVADPGAAREALLADPTSSPNPDYLSTPWPVAQDPNRRTDQNRVLMQGADGRFTVHTVGSDAHLSRIHYGNAVADFDGDGRVDVVVGNLRDGYSLLRNRGALGTANHRVTIALTGDGKAVNRDAVGTTVVVTDSTGKRHTGLVQIGGSLGSGSDIRLQFGLGEATIDRVEVHWPDGTVQTFDRPEVDSTLGIAYGRSTVTAKALRP